MAVKANWQNGEQFNASDANAVADAVNAAYVKPTGGVPITDLTASVQVSLGKADTAVQSVNAASITDSTTTGRAVITAVDAAAGRTALGVSYGSTAGTVVEGNDSRLSPSSTSITDSTATGRSLLTAVDPAAARSAIGVAYGSTGGTVAQGNDSRIVGAEQAANKGVANGYASLDGGGKVPVSQLPSSIMEYQGTFNASTGSPTLANGTGNTGDVYRVTVAGTQNFGAGNISFEVGDYVIYNGSVWEKSDTTDAVSTVAGLTGDVTASSLREAIATGTPSSTTYLRGDGTWSTVSAGITRSVQTIDSPTTLGSAANTDYTYFLNGQYAVDGNVSALLHGEGTNGSTTFTDSSLTPSTWGRYAGSASISTTQKKFGSSSLYFPGGSNIISTGSYGTSNFAFGTGDFTIEMWFYCTAGGYQALCWQAGGAFIQLNTNTVRYILNGVGEIIGLGGSLPLNQWNHVALCRSNGSLRLFGNGTQIGSTVSHTNNYNPSGAFVIASEGTNGAGSFTGYIDEFRVTKNARYTANFTVPSAPFTDPVPNIWGSPTFPSAAANTNRYTLANVAKPISTIQVSAATGQKIDMSAVIPANTILNDGTSTNNSTLSGAPSWTGDAASNTAVTKFTNVPSYFFTGVLNPIANADQNFAFGKNDFCIEFWMYRLDTANRVIYEGRSGTESTGGYGGPFPTVYIESNKVYYTKWDAYTINSTTTVNANTWYHVAVCRRNFVTTLYINGVAEATQVDTGTYLNKQMSHYSWSGRTTPMIGATNTGSYSDSWNYSFYGYLSNIRICNGFAPYSSNFSVPDENFASDKGLLPKFKTVEFISDGTMFRAITTQ